MTEIEDLNEINSMELNNFNNNSLIENITLATEATILNLFETTGFTLETEETTRIPIQEVS